MTNEPEDVVSIDLDDLLIEEIEFIEDRLDMSIADVGTFMQDPHTRAAKPLRVIAAVGHRRNHPELTLSDAFEQAGRLRLRFKAVPVPPTGGNGFVPSLPLSRTMDSPSPKQEDCVSGS